MLKTKPWRLERAVPCGLCYHWSAAPALMMELSRTRAGLSRAFVQGNKIQKWVMTTLSIWRQRGRRGSPLIPSSFSSKLQCTALEPGYL